MLSSHPDILCLVDNLAVERGLTGFKTLVPAKGSFVVKHGGAFANNVDVLQKRYVAPWSADARGIWNSSPITLVDRLTPEKHCETAWTVISNWK